MTSKLTALIKAAKEVNVPRYLPERTQDEVDHLRQAWILYRDLTNPATILELCALLEKAEATIETALQDHKDGFGLAVKDTKQALAAIKQWKGE